MKLAIALLMVLALGPAPTTPARFLSCKRLLAEACGSVYAPCCCQPVLGASQGRVVSRWLGPAAAAAAAAQPHQPAHSPAAGIPSYQTCCRDATLFCQTFTFAPPGIPGACPPPSLCLPCPEVGCPRNFLPCMQALVAPCPCPLPLLSHTNLPHLGLLASHTGLRRSGRQPLLPAPLRRQRRLHMRRGPEVRGRGRGGWLVRRLPAPPGCGRLPAALDHSL